MAPEPRPDSMLRSTMGRGHTRPSMQMSFELAVAAQHCGAPQATAKWDCQALAAYSFGKSLAAVVRALRRRVSAPELCRAIRSEFAEARTNRCDMFVLRTFRDLGERRQTSCARHDLDGRSLRQVGPCFMGDRRCAHPRDGGGASMIRGGLLRLRARAHTPGCAPRRASPSHARAPTRGVAVSRAPALPGVRPRARPRLRGQAPRALGCR